MRVGVVFPQTEIGADVEAIRRYALGVERLGFSHLLAYDHVLGADPEVHPDLDGPYDIGDTFHEPLVLFGYLAAITSLELVTGVIILPQRQTALVAKQAAEVDILCRGRLRLGIGLGWNPVEYEALGRSFESRGARVGEQVALLRELWTRSTVTHEGPFERVTGAGLNPPPRQRPIPIWFGANTRVALRRAGRLGDGWFPQVPPGPELAAALAEVEAGARAAGRDPSEVGMQGSVSWRDQRLSELEEEVRSWEAAGASHLSINTMGAQLRSVEDHLQVLGAVAGRLGLKESSADS